MVKKKKKTKKRTGIIEFTPTGGATEYLPVKALSWRLEENINNHYKVNELGIKIELYDKEILACTDPEKKVQLQERRMELTAKFYDASEWATSEKTMHMIDRPDDWFDTLTKEDMDDLKRKVMFWNMRVDVDELGFEILQHLYYFFSRSKGKATFTGEQVADEIEKLKFEYLSLKKKPKSLDTVLRTAKQQIAEDALTPIQAGP